MRAEAKEGGREGGREKAAERDLNGALHCAHYYVNNSTQPLLAALVTAATPIGVHKKKPA